MSFEAKDAETHVSRAQRELADAATLWSRKRSTFILLLVGLLIAISLYAYTAIKPTAKVSVSTAPSTQAQPNRSLGSADQPAPVVGRNQSAAASSAGQSSVGDCSPNMNGVVVGGNVDVKCPR